MDVKFSSIVQTAMQVFGRDGGPKKIAPPKSQDPADGALHEYYIGDMGRSIYKKRRDDALVALRDIIGQEKIDAVVQEAHNTKATQRVELLRSEHYVLQLQVNSPSASVDAKVFEVELLKAGVNANIVAKAKRLASGGREPNKIFTVTTTLPREIAVETNS